MMMALVMPPINGPRNSAVAKTAAGESGGSGGVFGDKPIQAET